ncbi:MAG: 1-deoxy-D-xylulose-5-phosphate reductoisomerase [Candidatus Marinimicrobia bacterium]|nr:1-deoxy-D-xylulose-5-phosphate reductoisomerase [Candidatus Neomarinimicrobiota bacterium]MBT3617412.1 1-deoxy-D-xylulose-5-phosphate reductoisomerase [Candidatus Neomarinimicrobiota bacterium]MBT3829352.1 1-deoxy-D-xylulose-5-phosphate reductoisomerase [Candidatus Neomarinimicrobiota bacterium]MBT3997635.1 1-deoxy-D-xylulose-5-phosphate reductoisomerase [Candidatus Neomarinimicrobiota bacterium]MBT4280933.1 1-deoxy-D-xylulose-5-phosphate reductoisomerase [Candidatus Neomarinimicrobiota bact
MPKRITILGSTGSIGINAIQVIDALGEEYRIDYLSANTNSEKLIEQALLLRPKAVCIVDEDSSTIVQSRLHNESIEVLTGRDGLLHVATQKVDILLNGLVGSAGMEPTLKAVEAGTNVALSNKESLVMAGQLIENAKTKSGAEIFPVDSEHSAIWQCLKGELMADVNKLILTGSGGPFRERDINTFSNISPEEALNHPNWDMGKKITIDSATMMNKGLEVIEAHWLFGTKPDDIDIIVHPQSIIHSMVEFSDGSVKAQMGVPDMKIPIQYAITYPRHKPSSWESLDLLSNQNLTFQAKDIVRFPCIQLAYDALHKGGTAQAVLNVANEHAVYRFLDGSISFTDIPRIVEGACELHEYSENPDLDNIIQLERWTKNFVVNFRP